MSAVTTFEALLSPEEYLQGERLSETRHEYLAGRAYAMAGASVNHNIISGNIFGELFAHLRGKKCRPFIADMKVHIRQAGNEWFYYPDVLVACSASGQREYYCDEPSVLVEVLSKETEKTDRREKLMAYQSLPSVHTYVLVAQEQREVTVYHRRPDGWEKTVLTGEANLKIPELEFSISLDAVYAETGL